MTTNDAIKYVECTYLMMKIQNNESEKEIDEPVDRMLEYALEKTVIAAKANILMKNTYNRIINNNKNEGNNGT